MRETGEEVSGWKIEMIELEVNRQKLVPVEQCDREEHTNKRRTSLDSTIHRDVHPMQGHQ